MKKSTIVCIVLVIVMIVTGTYIGLKKNSLSDQRAGQRWSEDEKMDQITIIYPQNMTASLDSLYFEDTAHRLQDNLDKSAFADKSGLTDERGLTFPFAISAGGDVTIEHQGKRVSTAAIGVDESFFTFHPVYLLTGAYISGKDLMGDGIIIDEEIAWNLFGSSDVVGQSVNIGGIPHYIRGVVQNDSDRFSKAAGLDKSISYVSLSSLKAYGSLDSNYVFEMILPDPVENFAMELVRDTYGSVIDDYALIDNTNRFNMSNCLRNIKNFGIRSMSSIGIIFPYYENVARAWEDVFCVLYMIQCISAIVIILTLLYKFIQFRRTAIYKKFSKAIKLQAPWKWGIWGRLSHAMRREKNEKKN